MVSRFKKKKKWKNANLFWKSCPPLSPPSLHPPPLSPPAQMDSCSHPRCHWEIKTVFTITLSSPAPWEQTLPWWVSLPPCAWLDSIKSTSLGGKAYFFFSKKSNFPSASHERHVGHYRRSHHPSDGSLFSSHCCVDNWFSAGLCRYITAASPVVPSAVATDGLVLSGRPSHHLRNLVPPVTRFVLSLPTLISSAVSYARTARLGKAHINAAWVTMTTTSIRTSTHFVVAATGNFDAVILPLLKGKGKKTAVAKNRVGEPELFLCLQLNV